jgi:hypothetical protein
LQRRRTIRIGLRWAALIFLTVLGVQVGTVVARPGQTYSSFQTPTPLPAGETLIIGFLGGWEKWDDPKRGVRKFASRLREKNLPGVHVETVENHRRYLAIQLVKKALDRNADGTLDDAERSSASIILFGQSFGGAAVNKASRELAALGVPVRLSVQVDSVGRGDGEVPANVRRAVNFYQRNDIFFIRGERDFRAADPARTEILGNFQWNYRGKRVDMRDAHWYQKIFKQAHVRMEQDPELWAVVEKYILEELTRLPQPHSASAAALTRFHSRP